MGPWWAMGVYPWYALVAEFVAGFAVGAGGVWWIVSISYRGLKAENARLTKECQEARDHLSEVNRQRERLIAAKWGQGR